MKTFIIASMFMAATVFPILFFPLLALTLVTLLLVGPYAATHTKWFESDNKVIHS